jgi:hypothetical protein
VEQPRDPLELVMSLGEETAEFRATVGHLSSDLSEVKQISGDLTTVCFS